MSDISGLSVSGLIRSSRFILIGNLLGKLSTLVFIPIYSWLIDPTDFGVIFTIQAICSFLLIVAPLSVEVGVSRYYFEQKTVDDIKRMFSSSVISLFVLSGLFYSVLILMSGYVSDFFEFSNPLYLIFGFLYSFFGSFFPVGSALLLAEGKVKGVAVSTVISNFLLVVFNLIFVFNFKDKILGYILSYLVFYFVQFVLFWVVTRAYFQWLFDWHKVKLLYSYSVQFILSNVSGWLVALSDRVMLLKMVGSDAVGLYSAGYTIASGPNVIVNSINQAYVPYTYSVFSSNDKKRENELSMVMMALFVLFSILFLGIVFFVEEIVLLLGPSYRDADLVIRVVVFGYYFNALKLIVHNPLSYDVKMVKYKSFIWLFTAFLNVGLNFYFIPLFSFDGAAYATMFAFLVSLFPVYFLSQHTKRLKLDFKTPLLVLILFSSLFVLSYLGIIEGLIIKSIAYLLFTGLIISQNKVISGFFIIYIKKLMNGVCRF